MSEKNKKIIGGLLAVLLIGALIYYFYNKSKEGQANNIRNQLGGTPNTPNSPSAAPASPQAQIIYTSPSPVSGGSVFLPWGITNANTKKLQNQLVNVWGRSLPKFGADGQLGNETVAAMSKNFPDISANVGARQYMTKAEFDVVMSSKPKSSTNFTNTSSWGTGSSSSSSSSSGYDVAANVATGGLYGLWNWAWS